MKYIKPITLAISLLFLFAGAKAQYMQLAEVISSGGGESTGGNYTNFGVIGETFVDYPVTGGNYKTSIGFLYTSESIPNNVNESNVKPIINVYPNPSLGKFTVENATEQIQVFDLYSRLVLCTNKVQIDMNGFAKGVYIWQVGSERGKLIIH